MKFFSKYSSRKQIFFTIPFLLVFLGAGVLVFGRTSWWKSEPSPLETLADRIIEKCSDARHHPACYDEEIPKLLDQISLEEAFEVTKLVQEKDRNYWYCHVLGHNLSARETAQDPARWKDVVSRCPSGMCSNGCLHGAFQEKFRTDALPEATITELKEELRGICVKRPGWDPAGIERATCYHALGHLAMYVTNADLKKSTVLCEEVTREENAQNWLQICYDGTFMQIFQPLEPEDFALVKGKQPAKETVQDFCWNFDGEKRSSCWSESWPLFFAQVTTPEGLVSFCSILKENKPEENRCYSALFYVLTAQFNFNENKIREFCSNLPQERKGQCFANAASRFIETDSRLIQKSIGLCQFAALHKVEKDCYQELLTYSTYNFHSGSPESTKLCTTLPDPWNKKCLERQ